HAEGPQGGGGIVRGQVPECAGRGSEGVCHQDAADATGTPEDGPGADGQQGTVIQPRAADPFWSAAPSRRTPKIHFPSSTLVRVPSDGLQPFGCLCGAGPGDLLDDPAIAQEDQRRPKLHAERTAKRFALAVFDLEVPDLRILSEQGRELRLKGEAVPAPR